MSVQKNRCGIARLDCIRVDYLLEKSISCCVLLRESQPSRKQNNGSVQEQ